MYHKKKKHFLFHTVTLADSIIQIQGSAMRQIILIIMMTFFCFFSVFAGTKKEYPAKPVNPSPPRIDGKMDDPIWNTLPAGTGFFQREPDQGKPATEVTWFKVAYDHKNLYILIRAEDSSPADIKARLSRRDDLNRSDRVGIMIDSYHDRRTAFEFSLNPIGVKRDGIWSNDNSFDSRPDPVWEGKTSVDEKGWTAEFRIPLSQLRFNQKSEQVWGFQVYRYIHRKQEYSLWQYISPDSTGFVSNFGLLTGIGMIQVPRRMELLPYSMGRLKIGEKEEGNPLSKSYDFQSNAGLDAKIGLSSNLTLDLTINPDFGQVEVDPSEVNLTAFETYYTERRPFFIEGSDILEFPFGIGDGGLGRDQLFYSRRIGKRPYIREGDFSSDEDAKVRIQPDEYVKVPENTTILMAGKVTGQLPGGLSIGMLNAVTPREYATISDGHHIRKAIVEPLTNYSLINLTQKYRDGQTQVGLVGTSVIRDLSDSVFSDLNRTAWSGGVRFSHEFANRTYYVDGKLLISRITGEPAAILKAQESSSRYFQRPDADHVEVDSSLTSLSGHAGTFSFGRIGNGKWRFMLFTLWRSPGFEVNDLGYIREVDRLIHVFWMGYRNQEPGKIALRKNFNINIWNGRNFDGLTLSTGGNINGNILFTNYYSMWMGFDRDMDGNSVTLLRGGPAMKTEGRWNFWFGISTDNRKKYRFELFTRNSISDDHVSRSHGIGLEWRLDFNHRFNIEIEPDYNYSVEDLQYITTEDVRDGQKRYIFGRIHQHVLSSTIRFNISLTPEFSIQYYGQPFIATGKYSHYKMITNPRAEHYIDRFHTYNPDELRWNPNEEAYEVNENGMSYSFGKPDFNYHEFHSNLVVRWEYRPGSTLYLVWGHVQNRYSDEGRFQPAKNLVDLLSDRPDTVFLLKMNYWFSV